MEPNGLIYDLDEPQSLVVPLTFHMVHRSTIYSQRFQPKVILLQERTFEKNKKIK